MPVRKRWVTDDLPQRSHRPSWGGSGNGRRSGSWRKARMAIAAKQVGISARKAPAKKTGASISLVRMTSCGPSTAETMPPARIQEIARGL